MSNRREFVKVSSLAAIFGIEPEPTTPAAKDTCASCSHFGRTISPRTLYSGEGDCRRFPPTFHGSLGCKYPTVTIATPACGEYNKSK